MSDDNAYGQTDVPVELTQQEEDTEDTVEAASLLLWSLFPEKPELWANSRVSVLAGLRLSLF